MFTFCISMKAANNNLVELTIIWAGKVIVTCRMEFPPSFDRNQKYTLRSFTIPPKMVIVILPIVVLSFCKGRLPVVNAHTGALQHRMHRMHVCVSVCRHMWIYRNQITITALCEFLPRPLYLPVTFLFPLEFIFWNFRRRLQSTVFVVRFWTVNHYDLLIAL